MLCFVFQVRKTFAEGLSSFSLKVDFCQSRYAAAMFVFFVNFNFLGASASIRVIDSEIGNIPSRAAGIQTLVTLAN